MTRSIALFCGLIFAVAFGSLACAGSNTPAAAQSPLPPLKEGATYAQVRADLEARGYRPQPPPYPDPTRCDEQAVLCAAFPELVMCFEWPAYQPCQFLWRGRDGELVIVQVDRPEGDPRNGAFLVDKVETLPPDQVKSLLTPGPKFPRFRLHTPYPRVRSGLIRAGYIPQAVLHREPEEPACDLNHLCKKYPEVLGCSSSGVGFCDWLFRRKSDGLYVTVLTDGDMPTFVSIYEATAEARKASFPAHRKPPAQRPASIARALAR